ncbi:MAG: lytic transglycosylase domain-containing protein [Rickettsiales bacterium]|jgi:soluble lytic murein transglycosylase|nr:lytic transglycosylase domain-containing protein [Rickettsiales bacterium]
MGSLSAKPSTKNLFFETNKDIETKLEITDTDMKIYKETIKLLEKGDYVESLSWANSIESENLRDAMSVLVLWNKYKKLNENDHENNFSDLLDFIRTHQYLPDIDVLKEKAENMYIKNDIPYQFVEKYFQEISPKNPKTVLKLLYYKQENIQKVFHEFGFAGNSLELFIKVYGKNLTKEDYNRKIENLILDKKFDSAKFLFQFIDEDYRKLYSSIIRGDYNNIPKSLGDNELLLYNKFLKLHRGKKAEAPDILLNLKKELSYPDKWWVYQKYYSREFFKKKDYKKAYFLATNCVLRRGTLDYADSEWLAGWLSLEFLNDPKTAYRHFFNLFSNVTYPISKSRGAYWLGRTMEKANNKKDAIEWYKEGSKYTLYFYGQLSMYARNELLNVPSLTGTNPLPEVPTFTEKEESNIISDEITTLAYLIKNTGGTRDHYTKLFRKAIDNTQSLGERAAIFEIVKSTKDEALVTNIARYLSYKGIYFVNNLFPVLVMINLENTNANLIHAIIKQESGFHISAESKVGASGFMQVMPSTAKDVANRMKIKFDKKALSTNPIYNILIGSYYINMLLNQFNGNQILAIASYNSGPNPVKRWIERYGDPREMGDVKDIVNWVESVEYSETRDYIQRIIENSVVYEYILQNNNT